MNDGARLPLVAHIDANRCWSVERDDMTRKGKGMCNQQGSGGSIFTTIGWVAVGVAPAVLIAAAAIAVSPRQAQATAAYAAETHLPCGKCHVNPAGGGPNTDFGKAFAANGHKLPKK
jgi:hypothetical protein